MRQNVSDNRCVYKATHREYACYRFGASAGVQSGRAASAKITARPLPKGRLTQMSKTTGKRGFIPAQPAAAISALDFAAASEAFTPSSRSVVSYGSPVMLKSSFVMTAPTLLRMRKAWTGQTRWKAIIGKRKIIILS